MDQRRFGYRANRHENIFGVLYVLPHPTPPTTLSRGSKLNGGQAKKGRDGKYQWCSIHEPTTHNDADCRIQHHNNIDGGDFNCTTHACYPTVLSKRDQSSGRDPERPCISFTVVEEPAEEERFWLFGLTDEPVTSF